MSRQYECDSLIFAPATPIQTSALAIIRASGTGCLNILSNFYSGNLKKRYSHGFFKDIDEVVVLSYEEGRGFTSEESFEIICHGGIHVLRGIMICLYDAGFRSALPGEFTYRAYMHGRIDLTQAEAVAEIASARSVFGSRAALKRLRGDLSDTLKKIRNSAKDILMTMEVGLSYPEDELPDEWFFPDYEIRVLSDEIENITQTLRLSLAYHEGIKIVLAGRPNAGKSSFFNLILDYERSIVSPEPGTTRDYIEASFFLDDNIPVDIFDTAGLRDDASGGVEEEGIKRTRMLMENADLIVYILDGAEELDHVPKANEIIVRSKRDITGIDDPMSYSAVTSEGFDDVLESIADVIREKVPGELPSEPMVVSVRQSRLLNIAKSYLMKALNFGEDRMDLAANQVRNAVKYITDVIGDEDRGFGDEELKEMFGKFCLGK